METLIVPRSKQTAENELAASLFSRFVQILAAIQEPMENSLCEKLLKITSYLARATSNPKLKEKTHDKTPAALK